MEKQKIIEFLNRLEGEEGCNFREKEKGNPKSITWDCDGKTHKFSRKILTKMNISKIEQDIFLEECEMLGGYCDCEILLNAEEGLLGEEV